MTKKTLFIHIGSHKTASTFVQSSLARNAKTLESLGLLYPQSGRIYEAHFKLGWPLNNKKIPKDTPLTQVKNWGPLIEEIKASTADAAVISSEEFGFYVDPSRLEALKADFDVRIISYLRSPDGFLQSFYNQFVKDFSTRETRTLTQYMIEDDMAFLQTRTRLKPWFEIFGKDAFTLRLFDKAVTQDGGILADFLGICGMRNLPALKDPRMEVVQKVSLPPDLLEYLRLANGDLTEQDGHYAFAIELAHLAMTHKASLQTTRAGILSLKARQTLRRRYAAANLWAAQTLLDTDHNPFPWKDAPLPPSDFGTRDETASAATLGRVAALIQNAVPRPA